MIQPKDKLWFINNKLGKIEYITVKRIGKKDFTFRNKRNIYRADYSTIGTRYFSSPKELIEYIKQRKNARTEKERS